MDVTETLGGSVWVGGDLTGKDSAEVGEGVVQGLVVDALVQVLDEDVTVTLLSVGRISLGPHDSARSALDLGVVQGVQGLLPVLLVREVDVGVAEGLLGDGVSADSDGRDVTGLGEDLVEIGLGDGRVQFTHVDRDQRRVGWSSGLGRGSWGVLDVQLGSSVCDLLHVGGGRGHCGSSFFSVYTWVDLWVFFRYS